MRANGKILLVAVAMSSFACGDLELDAPRPLLNTQFEDWCNDLPCGWTLKAGSTRKVATWHEHDYAVALDGDGAAITQRAARPGGVCMRVDVVARADRDAKLVLALDFDGDGRDDLERELLGQKWKRHTLVVHPPESYAVAHYVLRKSGAGSAAVASIETSDAGQLCYDRVRLEPSSYCLSDESCKVGHRCVDGICSLCMNRACERDAPCDDDAQCQSGVCAGGRCSDCAASRSCPARAPCSTSAQCQSGSCIFGSLPSTVTRPDFDGVCGECTIDSQCAGKRCVNGFCSECATDSQCSGLSCRYGSAVDAVERACRPPDGAKRARGQLCESNDDCEGSLRCEGALGRAKRCGVSCGADTDCEGGVCGVRAVRALPLSSERVRIPALARQPEAHVRTCYPAIESNAPCFVDQQCPETQAACCNGQCQGAIVNREDAMCTIERALL